MASATSQDAELDDHYDDYRTSVGNSSISILNDRDRPLPLVSSTSYTPQIIAAARDGQRNLAIEILGPNHHLVFPSPESSQVDGQDLGRLSSVSGLSEHSDRSPKRLSAKLLPSPPVAQMARSKSPLAILGTGVEKSISPPIAVSDSIGFVLKGLEQRPSPSMKGVKSPRMSMFIEDLEGLSGDSERPAASGDHAKTTAKGVDWPLGTPSVSPVLENHIDAVSAISPSEASRTATPLPHQGTPLATVISPGISLLPKFLRSKSAKTVRVRPVNSIREDWETGHGGKAVEPEEKSSHDEAVSPNSFFDDESSDGGDDSEISGAQEAVITSPVVIKNGSATKVGLKEILGSTPPAGRNNAGSSPEQATEPLGGELNDEGFSIQNTYVPQNAQDSKDGPVHAGLWKQTHPFNSSLPKTTIPSQQLAARKASISAPKDLRKVSFPGPAPLDIKAGHRFLRQSIVSTPYPTDEDEEHQKTKKKKVSISAPTPAQSNTGLESVLTLVIHSGENAIPRVKRITLPLPLIPSFNNNNNNNNNNEKQLPTEKPSTTPDFNDEKLFKLIKKEYVSVQGTIRQLFSARTVQTIHLSHDSNPQISNPAQARTQDPDHPTSNVPTLLSLFHKPRLGRTSHTWIQHLRSHPSSPNTILTPSPTTTTSTPTPTLHIHSPLSPLRLTLALLTITLLSLTSTLFWIFLGYPHNQSNTDNIKNQASSSKNAFGVPVLAHGGEVAGGAGARVGSGALVGVLVLGLGWTGVVGWGVVCWLVG